MSRIPVCLVCGLATILGVGCTRSPNGTKPSTGLSATAKVQIEKPIKQKIRRVEQAIGRLEAAEVVPIQAKVPGYLKTLVLDLGDRVKKGQLLAELSAPEIDADLDQKKAALGQAEAMLVQSKAGAVLAKASVKTAEAKVGESKASLRRAEADAARWRSEFARTQQLADERAVTQSVLDESRSKLESAEAALDADRAKVSASQAALGEAQAMNEKANADVIAAASGVEFAKAEVRHADVMVAYTKMTAPFDGTIVRRHADSGILTSGGSKSDPIFVLARTNLLTAALVVPERVALSVGTGSPVELRFPGLRDRIIQARVSRTSRIIDAATGTGRVEVDIPNPDDSLEPGLYVRAGVVIEERSDAMTLPATSVIRSGGQESVACIESGKIVRKSIATGIEEGTRVEVKSGLTGDETVVKENGGNLAVGQAAEPAPPAPPAPPVPQSLR